MKDTNEVFSWRWGRSTFKPEKIRQGIFNEDLIIYLKNSGTERERDKASLHWLTLQVSATTLSGLEWSQEQTPSNRWQEINTQASIFCLPSCVSKKLHCKLYSCSMHLHSHWDACLTHSDLQATVPWRAPQGICPLHTYTRTSNFRKL